MNKYIGWLEREMKEHPKDVSKAYLFVYLFQLCCGKHIINTDRRDKSEL